MFLLTTHGSIICADAHGALSHYPLMSAEACRLQLDIGLAETSLTNRLKALVCRAERTPGTAMFGAHEITLGADGRLATISLSGSFCSAVPGSPALATDRNAVGGWETFLSVSVPELERLRFILANDWVCASSGKVCRVGEIGFSGFSLVIGELEIDLRSNLPLLPNGDPVETTSSNCHFSYVLLIDGWRIERIYLYRPLIYFTAFRSPAVLQQAILAIESLLELGDFDGHIHIITDQPAAFFLEAVGGLRADRLSIQALSPKDWVGYVAAKYAIVDRTDTLGFQPVLFLDTDVICDAPIEPLLAAIATASAMTAQIEDMTWLQYNPSVGASLIQRAQLDPRFARGFNGGTIGIPNLVRYGPVLNVISTIIVNQAEASGRHQFRWVDQEVANYVSYCLAHFDTHTLSRYIRFGWQNDEFDPTRRLGLVHFWPGIENRPKEQRMADYLATLRRQTIGALGAGM